MLTQITAPQVYHKPFHLFLAGGISNCPPWQDHALELLKAATWIGRPLITINPRRGDFNLADATESEKQIKWEHAMLNMSDGVLFWFPEETLCPITLYELGKMAPRNKPLFVGCHPGYKRKSDVVIQLGLIREDVVVHDTMEKLVGDVLCHIMREFHPLQYNYGDKGQADESVPRGSKNRALL